MRTNKTKQASKQTKTVSSQTGFDEIAKWFKCLGLDLQKTVQVLGSVVTRLKLQPGKVETGDAQ